MFDLFLEVVFVDISSVEWFIVIDCACIHSRLVATVSVAESGRRVISVVLVDSVYHINPNFLPITRIYTFRFLTTWGFDSCLTLTNTACFTCAPGEERSFDYLFRLFFLCILSFLVFSDINLLLLINGIPTKFNLP